MVQLLLEHEADMELRYGHLCLSQPSITDSFIICSEFENGYTSLMMAAMEGDEIIVDILIACVSLSIACVWTC